MADEHMSNVSSEESMEEVQKFDCPFTKYSRHYCDKFKNANSWVKVDEKFNITPSEAAKRVNNIRTAYGRVLKEIENAHSGSGSDLNFPNRFSTRKKIRPT